MTTKEETTGFLRIVIPADLGELSHARMSLARFAAGGELPESRLFDLQVVASEAIANGIEHAASEVELRAWLLPDRISVEVENDGRFLPGPRKGGTGRARGTRSAPHGVSRR